MPGHEPPKLRDGELVKERWKVTTALGTGAFGAVYLVEDQKNPGTRLAMKTEDRSAAAQILKMEIAVLKRLSEVNALHACRMITRGKTEHFNYLVMTLTSKSLQHIRKSRPQKTFSLSTALRVGIQCVNSLEELHRAGYIHRDIKPGNFAVGRRDNGENKTVFILDFGLARAFVNKDNTLRTPRESTGFRGTVRYAPLACHHKEELSRKDDLESWFYQQVELMTSQVPWHNTNDKVAVGLAKESSRRNGSLYHRLPSDFHEILEYLDGLHYVDEPDYALVISHLEKEMKTNGFQLTEPFDWDRMPDVE